VVALELTSRSKTPHTGARSEPLDTEQGTPGLPGAISRALAGGLQLYAQAFAQFAVCGERLTPEPEQYPQSIRAVYGAKNS
jgi:hypothetical protein